MRIDFQLPKLLGERRMKQKDLIDATGVSHVTVSKMYNNQTKQIPVDALCKICEALGCDLSDLIKLVPDEDDKRD